ncbi:MAG: endonuclease [Candidatus Kapaibacterium sp.]
MKEIKLTQGKIALVDDEDYEYLNQFKWCAARQMNTFYAVRNVRINKFKTKMIFMHRVILKTPSGKITDHKDHNGLNNQKNNIRVCTNTQNQMNNSSRGGSSRYIGVFYDRGAIRACITVNKKNIYLGTFNNEIEAAIARDKAAKIYHGEFANFNFKLNADKKK